MLERALEVSKRIAAASLVAGSLASCIEQLNEGTIIEKQNIPPYTTLVAVPAGKSAVIIPIFHPETWMLTIEQCLNEKQVSCKQSTINVDEQTYEDYELGEHFVGNEDK